MRELIKESIVDLKKSDGFVYVTAEGKKIDLHEAASRGISVTPVKPKDGVIKKLESAGLFLTDNKFLADLNELISSLNGTISFREMTNSTILICSNLNFYMSRFFNKFFHIHTIITKCSRRFVSCGGPTIV